MIKVSVIGATGYAGAELLRLLHGHPEVEVVHITSESSAGKPISELYPHLILFPENVVLFHINIPSLDNRE